MRLTVAPDNGHRDVTCGVDELLDLVSRAIFTVQRASKRRGRCHRSIEKCSGASQSTRWVMLSLPLSQRNGTTGSTRYRHLPGRQSVDN